MEVGGGVWPTLSPSVLHAMLGEGKLVEAYVVWSFLHGDSYATVKSHLAALRALSVGPQSPDRPPRWSDLVSKLLNGFQKLSPTHNLERSALPRELLYRILRHPGDDKYTEVLMKAALSLAWHGCLRVGEYCEHLVLAGVVIATDMKSMRVTLRRTKTSAHRPVTITVHAVTADRSVCPVVAMKEYLAMRDRLLMVEALRQPDAPLFVFDGGMRLNHAWVTTYIRRTARALGWSAEAIKKLSSHSVRIGAATTAALGGAQPDEIKALGRWKSKAFERYVRIPASVRRKKAQSILRAAMAGNTSPLRPGVAPLAAQTPNGTGLSTRLRF